MAQGGIKLSFLKFVLEQKNNNLCHSSHSQVMYIITLLIGPAQEFMMAHWEDGASFSANLPSFPEEMKWFLLQLHQSSLFVSDFATAFQMLALSTNWDQQAQYNAFYNGRL